MSNNDVIRELEQKIAKSKPRKVEFVPVEDDKQFKKTYLELISLRKKVKSLEENAEDVDKIENETGKTIADLRKNNLELISKLMAAEKNFEAFKTTKSVLNKQIEDLKDSVKALETEKTKIEQTLTGKLTTAITEIANLKESIETRINERIEWGLKEERAVLETEKQTIEDTKTKLKQRESVIQDRESFISKYGRAVLFTFALIGSVYLYSVWIPEIVKGIIKLSLDYKIIGVIAGVIALIVLEIIRRRRSY
jgi:chromosome segregation ATPase